jgi:hypothetical protein
MRKMTKSTDNIPAPADKFREAVQNARRCLLDGPLGLSEAFEAVKSAAECAEASATRAR